MAEEILDSGVVEWSVARHGDLRRGNVLASRGRLVGVVAWENWHAFAVPGADLLNLFAPHPGAEIGKRFSARPWLAQSFRKHTQVYWGSFHLEMTKPVLEAAAVAWWIGQLAVAARADAGVTSDERWIANNVDTAAAIFG
jgi:aminoglycoside phosphotransferase (APT) family kinase protein